MANGVKHYHERTLTETIVSSYIRLFRDENQNSKYIPYEIEHLICLYTRIPLTITKGSMLINTNPEFIKALKIIINHASFIPQGKTILTKLYRQLPKDIKSIE